MTASGGGSARVLAIRFRALGDVLLTFPALAMVKERYPQARLEVLTGAAFAPLMQAHPAVDQVLAPSRRGLRDELEIVRCCRRRRYDWVLDFHGTPRSRVVSALSGAACRRRVSGARLARRRLVAAAWLRRQLRRDGAPAAAVEPVALRAARLVRPEARLTDLPRPRLRLPPLEAELAASLAALPEPRVALCPGARHATKRWPERHYARLAAALADQGLGVIVVLGPGDEAPAISEVARRAPGALRLVGGSVVELAAALRYASACVGNDSGLTHLAVAAGVPAVVLFGPTVAELGFAPAGPHESVGHPGLGCRPCSVHGSHRCPRGDHACMNELDVDTVRGAALDQLAW